MHQEHLRPEHQNRRDQMADQIPDQPLAQTPAANTQLPERTINVWSPTGELQSLPESQIDDALQSGYTQATPEDYENWANQQRFGTPLEQLKTFGEGAASAATFGLSTGLEKAMGVPGRNIRLREEVNPISHGAGQVAVLAIPGVGDVSAAGALESVGSAASELIPRTGVISQIGSAAVKNAVETMMLTGGDEVSKAFAGDPDQSIQSAAVDIGLSGVLGGALGAGLGSVSPLWEATVGPKVTQMMEAISRKADGMEGIISDDTNNALNAAGVEVPGQVRSILSDIPSVRDAARNLSEASTIGGSKMREAIQDFKSQLSNGVLDVFGKTPDEVIAPTSDAVAGSQIKDSLESALRDRVQPISDKLNAFNEEFKNAPFSPEFKNDAQAQLDSLVKKEQWSSAAFKDEGNLASTVAVDLTDLDNASDLKKYIENLNKKYPFGSQLYYPAKQIKSILTDVQEKSVADSIMKRDLTSPAAPMLDDYQATRQAYGQFKGTLEDLNDRLHVGKYAGPEGFFQALQDMTPETAISRLAKTNDVGLLNLLQDKFPNVAEQIKQYHVNDLLESAARRAAGDESLNTKVLFSSLDKMSPELKQFILPEGSEQKLSALQELIENDGLIRKNPSGTAGVVDSFVKSLPNPAIGVATALMGAGHPLALGLSAVGNYLFREGGDALKLGLLKFLGNGQHISAGGLKAAVDLAASMTRANKIITDATKNIFKSGAVVLPEKLVPNQKDRDKLEKSLSALDPEKMINNGGNVAQYLPDHGAAAGKFMTNAVGFLKSVKPLPQMGGPLDKKMEITEAQKTQYKRYLDIAEQPLVVLKDIKDGTITAQDINAIETMHPALYKNLQSKLTEEMVTHLANGESIPYRTRIGLSLFMKEPLDASMQPQSIIGTQASFQPPPPPAPQLRPKHSFKNLGKSSEMYLTGAQAREERRSNA